MIKNKLFPFIMAFLITLILGPLTLHARPEDGSFIVSVFGIANQKVKQINTDQRDKSFNIGFGGLVEANVNGFLGVETGALFIKRQYEYSNSGASLVQQVDRLHIPVIAKFWPTNYVSLGVGPFVSFKTGSVDTNLNIGGVDLGTVQTSANDKVEFGFDLTAALNLSVAEKTGVFIEARYSSPFEQQNSEDYEELSALAGVKIQL